LGSHGRNCAGAGFPLAGRLVVQFTGASAVSAENDSESPAVKLRDLTVSYRQHPALHRISGQFARGSLTAVIGPNGAGKSTLLKAIAGLSPTQVGDETGQGSYQPQQAALQVNPLSQHLAYLPQHNELNRDFPLVVRDCVLLGLWTQAGAFCGATPSMLVRVDAALKSVGLQAFEDHPVGVLSSGQLQRALFARLLVQDAQLILLDEPFNGVDSKTAALLLAMVLQWHYEGRTVVAVLHNDALVRAHFPQTLLLARECIAWGRTEDVLTNSNLELARGMVESWNEVPALWDVDDTLDGGLDGNACLARRLRTATAT
jgi:zinc/manganese transport system ATP-binding protein